MTDKDAMTRQEIAEHIQETINLVRNILSDRSKAILSHEKDLMLYKLRVVNVLFMHFYNPMIRSVSEPINNQEIDP